MKEFNARDAAVKSGEAIAAAVREIEEKYGFRLESKRVLYDAGGFKMTLQVKWVGENGDGDRKAWECYGPGDYMRPEWYGRKFTMQGREYTLFGIALKSRRFPILARGADGKTYKFTRESILRIFEPACVTPEGFVSVSGPNAASVIRDRIGMWAQS